MPRRSGTTTVWSFASSAAIGDHMSPVLPKPWISTTAGPWPPTRTLIVASAFTTCELRKSAGKGVGAACADRAPSARLPARPAATRRKRRENVDETVADMLGSLGCGDLIRTCWPTDLLIIVAIDAVRLPIDSDGEGHDVLSFSIAGD